MLLGLGSRFALLVICPTSAQLVVVVKYNSGSVSDTANALSTDTRRANCPCLRSPGLLPFPRPPPLTSARPLPVFTPSRWPPTPPRRSRAPRRCPSTLTLSRPGVSRTCPRLASSSTRRYLLPATITSHPRGAKKFAGVRSVGVKRGVAGVAALALWACADARLLPLSLGQLRMLRPCSSSFDFLISH